MCRALGCQGLAGDPRFATLGARKQHEDELEDLVSSFTRAYPAHELMRLLQAAAVPAGAVQSSIEVLADPQLRHRGHFVVLDHPEIGRHACDRAGFLLSSGEGGPRRPAPCFGEHNAYVYTEMLGLSDEEFAALLAEGVFD